MSGSSRYVLWSTLGVIIALQVLSVLYFVFEGYKTYFNSDAAYVNIIAEEIIRQKTLFPTLLGYDREFVLASENLIATFYALFFENGYFVHALYVAHLLALTIVVLIWLLHLLDFSMTAKLFTIFFFLSPWSAPMREFIFGQGGYAKFVFNNSLFIGLTLNYIFLDDYLKSKKTFVIKNPKVILTLIGALQVFLMGASLRSFVIITLPLLIGLFLLLLHRLFNKEQVKPIITAALVFVFSTAFSQLAFYLISNNSGQIVTNNLTQVPNGWLLAFLERWQHGLNIVAEGLYLHDLGETYHRLYSHSTYYIKISLFSVALLVALYTAFSNKTYPKIFLLSVIFTTGFFINLVATTSKNILINAQSFRYFTVQYILLLLLIAFGIDRLINLKRLPKEIKLVLIASTLLAGSYGTYNFFLYDRQKFVPFAGRYPNVHEQLADILIEENVVLGYADFWHSYVTTVFSNFKSEIYPMEFPPGPHPLTPKQKYLEPKGNGKFAFIFRTDQTHFFQQDRFGAPKKIIRNGPWAIYIFDQPLGPRLVSK